MTFYESFAEFREMRDLLESLCQEMYNDVNDGEPSSVLRYCFYKEALTYIEEDPHDDRVVQALMRTHLSNAILTSLSGIVLEAKIQVPD